MIWLCISLYLVISVVGWVAMGRYEYRQLVADPEANQYAAYSNYRKEQRLEACRKDAMKAGAWSFLWPLMLAVAPFVGIFFGVRYLITSDVDKELEKKKQLEKAQKIVDDWNAEQKAKEEAMFADLDPVRHYPRSPIKCANCGLPHRTRDCDEEEF